MKFLFLLSFCLLPVCNGQSVLDIRPPAKSVHSLSNAYRQQQREEAQKQRDAIKADLASMTATMLAMRDQRERYADERDALRKDAERYRWLRDSAGNDIMEKLMTECSPPRWDELVDAAIDAAMGERP